jgi:hypothetical protein
MEKRSSTWLGPKREEEVAAGLRARLGGEAGVPNGGLT